MQVMGQGSGDVHEQTKKAMGGGSDSANQHNFFAPLNNMDPHQKAPDNAPVPKFNWKVFCLSGLGTTPEEQNEYTETMNKIATGEYNQLSEKTYHTVDGGIKVFVRWLEYPSKEKMAEYFDKAMEASSPEEVSKKKNKKSKKSKNKNKENYAEKDYLPQDPLVKV